MTDYKLICPKCRHVMVVSSDLLGQTIQCESCQQLITLPFQNLEVLSPVSVTFTPDHLTERSDVANSRATPILTILFVVVCLLHVLFSAEGVFYPWNWQNPKLVIANMVGYALPGILLSIVVILPFLHLTLPKPRPRLPRLKHLVWAVFLGFGIRLVAQLVEPFEFKSNEVTPIFWTVAK